VTPEWVLLPLTLPRFSRVRYPLASHRTHRKSRVRYPTDVPPPNRTL